MRSDVSTVTAKGRLVIPARLRRKFGLGKGTKVAFLEENSRLVLQPLTHEYIHGLRGSLKGEPSLLNTLLEARKKEFAREERK